MVVPMAVAASMLICVSVAEASKDPKVPPGRDPSGVPVAIIGPGIDYLAPGAAQKLARDGEGEIIGWDFIDGDMRPYEGPITCSDGAGCDAGAALGSSASQVFLAEADRSRLIVLRTKDGDRAHFASAVAFTAKSPARIVPAFTADATGAGPDWDMIIQAARRFSNLLFIVPAYGPPITIPGFESLALGNLVIVAPADPTGGLPAGVAGTARPWADVAVSLESGDADKALPPRAIAERAAARLAAIAARLQTTDPILNVQDLKARILQLVQPLPGANEKSVRSGWIAEPRRHYRVD